MHFRASSFLSDSYIVSGNITGLLPLPLVKSFAGVSISWSCPVFGRADVCRHARSFLSAMTSLPFLEPESSGKSGFQVVFYDTAYRSISLGCPRFGLICGNSYAHEFTESSTPLTKKNRIQLQSIFSLTIVGSCIETSMDLGY